MLEDDDAGPRAELGEVRVVAGAIRVTGETVAHRRGPRLGEDTERVLAELAGLSPEQIAELVDMIETQRAYEVNSKMISANDEMLRNANQQL